MPSLPPGPAFLLRNLHLIVTPPALVLSGVYALRRFFLVAVPLWLVFVASLVGLPLVYSGYIVWRNWRMQRNAAARGATLPPVADKRVGKMGRDQGFPQEFFFKMCEQYGRHFQLEMFGLKRYFTNEPEHIKAILASDFASFSKGGDFTDQMKCLLGVGIFNSDGDLWKFHRSMSRPFFSKDRISHCEIFDRHATDAIQLMKARMKDGYAVDWQDLVSRFTLDSATDFLFGKDVRSLSTALPYPPASETARRHTAQPEPRSFATAFYDALIASAERVGWQGLWPLAEFWADRVEPHRAQVDEFIRPILQAALRQKREEGADAKAVSEDDTLMSHLLKVTDDPALIRDEAVNILIAGRDTTACTLTFAVYNLAEHKEVLRRLREEVLSVVGPTRRPTYEDIRNMKFLRAVINETLRLHPPVPANIRTAVKDTVLPSATPGGKGIYVPAGMKVLYSVFMMHRREDLWGPDALKFDPDRFLDERLHKYLTPNPFIFLPFNAGPRICLGQQFAYNETSFMLIRLLQQVSEITFTPEVAPESVVPAEYNDCTGSSGTDRVWMGSHLTLYAKGGVWVKMTEAQNED